MGDGWSLDIPYKNIGKVGTGECTGDDNIVSIAQILAESFIDPVFFKLAVMG